MVDREDHDELEMVIVWDTMRFLWSGTLPVEGARQPHWDARTPRTAAEATWRNIVGQP